MSDAPVIETTGLTKRFGSQIAVDGISFTVERGQIFGFLGPNGSGKTTTIGMLLGIINATAGSFRLLGEGSLRGLHRVRQRVGATLETPNFYPYLSGRDNLRIVANVKRAPESKIVEVLDAVGLADRAKDRFRTYSLGMKQRLALAATMLGDTDLVILDEPANGLDPEGMREIREIILRLREQGRTIFLSSHLLWEVERTCTHVAIIKNGRIVRQASVSEMTAGTVTAGLRGGDAETLLAIVGDYPGAVTVTRQADLVIAELRDDDLAALNAFVAGRGIFLSHLALRQRSLEDVFIELTGEPPTGTAV
ncbi:MAG TPA: ATP-binding cassette domain-containing protein [Longimicrobiales bacterium]|nr:ATP-binding cassette domain-containing protein [Longimicrobiales bacterium]